MRIVAGGTGKWLSFSFGVFGSLNRMKFLPERSCDMAAVLLLPVAACAEPVYGFEKHRGIIRSMWIVTSKAPHLLNCSVNHLAFCFGIMTVVTELRNLSNDIIFKIRTVRIVAVNASPIFKGGVNGTASC